MSRELRQALEQAQVRLPELKKELAAGVNPAFLAEQQALLEQLRPLRTQVDEAEQRLKALSQLTEGVTAQLAVRKVARQAQLSRNQVSFWVLPLVGMVGVAGLSTLVTFAMEHPELLHGTALLVVGALPALALGMFLRLRIMPPPPPPRVDMSK
jgi:paraquat-inducible protein B